MIETGSYKQKATAARELQHSSDAAAAAGLASMFSFLHACMRVSMHACMHACVFACRYPRGNSQGT